VFLDPRLKEEIPRLRRACKEIFLIDLSGQPGESKVSNILIRPMTRQEFLFLQQDIDLGCDPTEQILQSCIIWPEFNWINIDKNPLYDLPCMCFEMLSKCIIDISGFSSNEGIADYFNEARVAINSLDSVMMTVITRHFHAIKPCELEDMTLAELTKLFAIAETSLEQPIDLRMFLDEEYAQKQVAKEVRKQKKQMHRGLPGKMMPDSYRVPQSPEGWNSAQSTE
jgi:hypothetical protein